MLVTTHDQAHPANLSHHFIRTSELQHSRSAQSLIQDGQHEDCRLSAFPACLEPDLPVSVLCECVSLLLCEEKGRICNESLRKSLPAEEDGGDDGCPVKSVDERVKLVRRP